MSLSFFLSYSGSATVFHCPVIVLIITFAFVTIAFVGLHDLGIIFILVNTFAILFIEL